MAASRSLCAPGPPLGHGELGLDDPRLGAEYLFCVVMRGTDFLHFGVSFEALKWGGLMGYFLQCCPMPAR